MNQSIQSKPMNYQQYIKLDLIKLLKSKRSNSEDFTQSTISCSKGDFNENQQQTSQTTKNQNSQEVCSPVEFLKEDLKDADFNYSTTELSFGSFQQLKSRISSFKKLCLKENAKNLENNQSIPDFIKSIDDSDLLRQVSERNSKESTSDCNSNQQRNSQLINIPLNSRLLKLYKL